MQPLILLGGLIVIPEFMYNYKNSIAYYEILMIDVARVVSKKNKANISQKSYEECEELNKKAIEKSLKRREFEHIKLSQLNQNQDG